MATSLGSTEKSNLLTCPMGSPKPLVRKKVGLFPLVLKILCCQAHAGKNAEVTVVWICFPDTRKEGPSLLLVLKWGGELTPAGRVQAEELGRAFRCMYPGGQGETKTQQNVPEKYVIFNFSSCFSWKQNT